MKIITAYKCGFCSRVYQMKHFCEKHEAKCKQRPENYQKCTDGCKHLVSKETETLSRDKLLFAYRGEEIPTNTKKLMYCNAKKTYIYPYWCKSPVEQDDLPDETPNEPMPKECEFYNVEF